MSTVSAVLPYISSSGVRWMGRHVTRECEWCVDWFTVFSLVLVTGTYIVRLYLSLW